MNKTGSSHQQQTRRWVLRTAGALALASLAGCSDDGGGEPTDGTTSPVDPTTTSTAQPTTTTSAFDCDTLAGSPTTYTPNMDQYPFRFVFDHPDTWEVYGEVTTEQTVKASLGHIDTKTSDTHPYTFEISQFTQPVGVDAAESWSADGNGESFDITYNNGGPPPPNTPGQFLRMWALGQGGLSNMKTVHVHTSRDEDRSSTWKFALPQVADNPHGAVYYPVQIDASGDCADTLYSLGTTLVQSLRRPARQPLPPPPSAGGSG